MQCDCEFARSAAFLEWIALLGLENVGQCFVTISEGRAGKTGRSVLEANIAETKRKLASKAGGTVKRGVLNYSATKGLQIRGMESVRETLRPDYDDTDRTSADMVATERKAKAKKKKKSKAKASS